MQQPLLALLGLHVHVGDLDAVDDAARDRKRERASRVVGVHVHLQRGTVADDEERVAERLEVALEVVRVEVFALEDEDGAIPVARQLLVDRFDGDLVRHALGRCRDRLPAQHRVDAAHDLDEPGRARVDDAGLLQHRQHLARPRDGLVAGGDDRREVRIALRRLGHRADRGEHRPLDGLLDGAVGGVARGAERLREVVALRKRVGRAAHDLREDHARVAARTHQRRARDLMREAGAVVGPFPLQPVVDGAHGQREVRAGVAVGHGIDVQVVDALACVASIAARAPPTSS